MKINIATGLLGRHKKIFKELITIAYERGKITLLDLPSYLSSRCGKANYLINEINTLTNQYKSYSRLVGNVDTSKLLIADQLSGMAGLMKTLASEVDTMVSFDSTRENKLIDELAVNNIICTDAVVYEKGNRTTLASVIVREEDVNKLKLQQVVTKICGGKMVINDVYPTEKAGLVNVNLKVHLCLTACLDFLVNQEAMAQFQVIVTVLKGWMEINLCLQFVMEWAAEKRLEKNRKRQLAWWKTFIKLVLTMILSCLLSTNC